MRRLIDRRRLCERSSTGRLLAIVAVTQLALGSCGGSAGRSADPQMKPLVRFEGGDMVTLEYVTRVLRHAGIDEESEGSFYWTISVPETRMQVARGALKRQVGILPYIIWSDGEDIAAAEEKFEETVLDVDYADALSTYNESTVLGKILRSKTFLVQASDMKGAVIRVVKWRERPFVDWDMRPTTALQGRVSIRRVDGLEREYSSFVFD